MRNLLVLPALFVWACGSAGSSSELPAIDGAGQSVTRIAYAGGATDVEQATGADRTGTFLVRLPPEGVFHLLPGAFESLGLEGGQILDTRRRIYGFMGTGPRRIAGQRLSNFIDCGHQPGGANADFYRVTLEVLAMARLTEEGSLIEFRVDGVARPQATTGTTVRCASLGGIERLIVNRVEEAAGITSDRSNG